MRRRDPIDRIREKLGPRELVGQSFFLGLGGENLSAEERELIRTIRPGGFILFRRNLPDREGTLALVDELLRLALEASRIPPLFALDEEGGFVSQTDRFAVPAPSQMALAATGRAPLVSDSFRLLGRRLRSLGIPLALTPVLDVNDCPANPVIGIRSFGMEPGKAAHLGRLGVEALRGTGVFPTGKHFPGHGSTSVDSHLALPTLSYDRKRLRAVELKPFREAIRAGVPVVMTAHVSYPEADPAGELPATFCPGITRGMLREEMGFAGLLMSDDLEMAAVTDNLSPREVSRLGREAGLDVFLFSRVEGRALGTWEATLEQLEAGRIERGDLSLSVSRILHLKRDWLGMSAGGKWGEPAEWRAAAPAWEEVEEEMSSLGQAVGRLAVAGVEVKKEAEWTPDPNDHVGVLVTRGQAGGRELDPRSVVSILEEYRGRVEVLVISADPLAGEVREFLARAQAWDRVLIMVLCRGEKPEGLCRMIEELARLERPVALLSVLTPCASLPLPGLVRNLVSYGFSEAALRAALDCLWGKAHPRGKLPLTPS